MVCVYTCVCVCVCVRYGPNITVWSEHYVWWRRLSESDLRRNAIYRIDLIYLHYVYNIYLWCKSSRYPYVLVLKLYTFTPESLRAQVIWFEHRDCLQLPLLLQCQSHGGGRSDSWWGGGSSDNWCKHHFVYDHVLSRQQISSLHPVMFKTTWMK